MRQKKTLDVVGKPVDNAITHWREGGLVAMPTETVYGLGADATNDKAVARIYALKSRPQFNPLIVHVANTEIAKRYVQWNAIAEELAAKFWPGPLTLVLKIKSPIANGQSPVSELVSAGGDTLAIRVPSHPLTLQLLAAFDGPIAAPSANRSGRVSPTTAQHIRDEFGDETPMIIDGGPCIVGLESTVLDISGKLPVLLRAGAITREMIEAVLRVESRESSEKIAARAVVPLPLREREGPTQWEGEGASIVSGYLSTIIIQPSPARTEGFEKAHANHTMPSPLAALDLLPQGEGWLGATLKSPGQLASHYAPSIPVRLNAVDVDADEALLAFGPVPLIGAATTLNLSSCGDVIEAAANVFAYLRALDLPRHRAIAVMPIPNHGVGEAINDRLTRASVRQ